MRTSFHHQPEAQHPKSSAIHKLPADYPIFRLAQLALSAGRCPVWPKATSDVKGDGLNVLEASGRIVIQASKARGSGHAL